MRLIKRVGSHAETGGDLGAGEVLLREERRFLHDDLATERAPRGAPPPLKLVAGAAHAAGVMAAVPEREGPNEPVGHYRPFARASASHGSPPPRPMAQAMIRMIPHTMSRPTHHG